MITILKYSISLLTILFTSYGMAEYPKTRIETMPLVDVGVPTGADDDLLAVAQYPNGCVERWSRVKESKNNTLVLVHLAKVYRDRVCTRAVEYREIEFDTDSLSGTYRVVDGHDGTLLGELDVDESTVDFAPAVQ